MGILYASSDVVFMKARILIEVIIVLMLGIFAYTKFLKPDAGDTVARASLNESQSTRLNELIKKSKTARPKVKAPRGDPAQDFTPEATSVQREAEPIPEIVETTLTGQILDDTGQPIQAPVTVYSTTCHFTGISSNGNFSIVVQPGLCIVGAQRTIGEHILEAQPMEVVIKEGEANPLIIIMPAELMGTVGIDLVLHETYAEVTAVAQGSPAAQIGMEPGHLIFEINGHKVASLSQDDIAASLSGPVDEEVRMLIVVETADGTLREIPVALGRIVLP